MKCLHFLHNLLDTGLAGGTGELCRSIYILICEGRISPADCLEWSVLINRISSNKRISIFEEVFE